MRLITVIFYFTIAIVIFGSFGVTIPYVFETFQKEKHNISSLNQNLITYYIAIFTSSSLDLLLKYIDKDISYKKPVLLGISLINIAVIVGTAFVLYNNSTKSISSVSIWILIGILISYITWWCAHYKDDSFSPSSSLGGPSNKPLTNG